MPDHSLWIESDGDVVVGTISSQAPLHVQRSDNTASLLVEDTGSGPNQNLLTLRKLTNAPFVRYESQFGLWDFSAGFFFVINDPADATIEFQINNAGNLTLTGALTEKSSREVKHAMRRVDAQKVLGKVLALPIAEWSYKEGEQVRHMGSMAGDFHGSFGLGKDDKMSRIWTNRWR